MESQQSKTVLLTEQQASARYGLSVGWFREKRQNGGGPKFKKIGESRNAPVRYPLDELEKFFDGIGLMNHTGKKTTEQEVKRVIESEAQKIERGEP